MALNLRSLATDAHSYDLSLLLLCANRYASVLHSEWST